VEALGAGEDGRAYCSMISSGSCSKADASFANGAFSTGNLSTSSTAAAVMLPGVVRARPGARRQDVPRWAIAITEVSREIS
jgi:hypothetical protein